MSLIASRGPSSARPNQIVRGRPDTSPDTGPAENSSCMGRVDAYSGRLRGKIGLSHLGHGGEIMSFEVAVQMF